MKKIIFIILFSTVFITTKAQINKDTVGLNLPVKNGRIVYTGIVKANGKTKGELYKNAQQALINGFYSQNNVIQSENREDGIIYGRGILYYSSTVGLVVSVNWANHFTIKIECKDNEYRYTFYNMTVYNYDSGNNGYDIEILLGQILGTEKWPWTKNAAKNTLKVSNDFITHAILTLETNMQATTTDF